MYVFALCDVKSFSFTAPDCVLSAQLLLFSHLHIIFPMCIAICFVEFSHDDDDDVGFISFHFAFFDIILNTQQLLLYV